MNCQIVLYAGKKVKSVVARQSICFNPNALHSLVTGKISKEEYDAYRMNTINEYCIDFIEMIRNKILVAPKIFVQFESKIEEGDNIDVHELVNSLIDTEKETDITTLKRKINKYFQ